MILESARQILLFLASESHHRNLSESLVDLYTFRHSLGLRRFTD